LLVAVTDSPVPPLTRSQGITLDPSERFLFAAGADHRVTLALALAKSICVIYK
jgi:hypothetical protein